jgi:multiple sugar transport system permease protein
MRRLAISRFGRTMPKGSGRRVAILWGASALMVAVVLFPYVWMLLTSIQPESDLFAGGFHYLPRVVTSFNYSQLLTATPIGPYFLSSAIVATASTALGLFVSMTAAYSFSRFLFRGRSFLMTLFLVIPMFPTVLILIPMFVVMRTLGLVGSYLALLIAYTTFIIPFSVWMLTGFLDAFPVDLEEAAMVDGCTRLGAVWRVLVPLAMPGVVATGIYIFIVAWNEFLFALMFTTKATRTLPVGIYSFVGEYDVHWGLLTAAGMVVTLPLIVVFFFVQGQLVQGLTAGAIKG